MSIALGSLAINAGINTSFSAPSDGCKAILIGNLSGLICTIKMESGGVTKTLYPGILDWFQVNRGFTGNILIQPSSILTNSSSFPASSLLFDAIGLRDPETSTMYPMALPGAAVNPTAAGQPKFSAFIFTTQDTPTLNVFNPAGSGLKAIFFSAIVSLSTANTNVMIPAIQRKIGTNLNFTNPLTPEPHQIGGAASKMLATWASAPTFGAFPIKQTNLTTGTYDFIPFPDEVELDAGANFIVSPASQSAGTTVGIFAAWTETAY